MRLRSCLLIPRKFASTKLSPPWSRRVLEVEPALSFATFSVCLEVFAGSAVVCTYAPLLWLDCAKGRLPLKSSRASFRQACAPSPHRNALGPKRLFLEAVPVHTSFRTSS